jgi:hypothetical protein
MGGSLEPQSLHVIEMDLFARTRANSSGDEFDRDTTWCVEGQPTMFCRPTFADHETIRFYLAKQTKPRRSSD